MSIPMEFQHRVGRCYELACHFVLYEGDPLDPPRLVHGSIQGYGHPRNDHAWVLFSDNTVLDIVMGRLFSPGAYEVWANALVELTYTRDQVLHMVNEWGHWGPWHEGLTVDHKLTVPDKLPEATVPSGGFRDGFSRCVGDYPKTGPAGVSYYLGVVNIGDIRTDSGGKGRVRYEVDNLLFRNSKGAVIGILQYFVDGAPMDLEQPGNLNIFVHPRRQRRGIATALVTEADRRWGPLNWEQQTFTPEGRALAEAYMAKRDRNTATR